MDFTTPWTPVLNGRSVRSFMLLEFAEKMGTSPETQTPRDDRWTVGAQSDALRDVARAPRAALLETVLRLWRLKMMGELARDSAMWGDMVEAWLVRSTRDGDQGPPLTCHPSSCVTAISAGRSRSNRSRSFGTSPIPYWPMGFSLSRGSLHSIFRRRRRLLQTVLLVHFLAQGFLVRTPKTSICPTLIGMSNFSRWDHPRFAGRHREHLIHHPSEAFQSLRRGPTLL